MLRRVFALVSLALCAVLLLGQPMSGVLGATLSRVAPTSRASTAQHAAITSDYGQLPLAFEVNDGQADALARFVAHGHGYTIALTTSEALLAVTQQSASGGSQVSAALPGQLAMRTTAPPSILGMAWLGANPHPGVTGEQPLPGTVNYFIGNDPTQWHTNIPTYQRVRLHDIYPGVDLVFYGNQGHLEYDFIVAPGANPAAIQLGFTGATQMGVDLAGSLSLTLPGEAVAQQKPLVYQQTASGSRQTVAGGFDLTGNRRVGFALGTYNPHLPLVIDPAFQFSTYLGGSDRDSGVAIAVDGAGNAYVAGNTTSTDFPTVNPVQSVNAGPAGYDDAFVTKFNPAGTALIYSTYIGGYGEDDAFAIALDSAGDAFIAGQTLSTNFPVLNAFQSTPGTTISAFVTKLTASGSGLWYSTYLGGNNSTSANGIAVDSTGSAYVVGTTHATNFPTLNPIQSTNHGATNAFVTKFNTIGNGLIYSTYLGGSSEDWGSAIALDGSGNAYITGYAISTDFPTTPGAFQPQMATGAAANAFVAKLNAAGSALSYSSYLGGNNGTLPPPNAPTHISTPNPSLHSYGTGFSGCGCYGEWGYGIVVNAAGDAYVTGRTDSHNFPITPGAFQTTIVAGGDTQNGFVTEFNASGSALIYSTFLSGSAGAVPSGIALDVAGNAYVVGYTTSTDFPTVNPLQGSLGSAPSAGFVSQVNAGGTALLYSSYLGGSTGDSASSIALNLGRDVYVTGGTASADFPIKNAFQSALHGPSDAFVTKMRLWPSVDTTTGVFRPSNGVLYLKNANTTGPADITLYYGQPGDQPVTGDWTGKGYKSIGVYRNGTFYLRNSNTTGYADIVVAFGASTDIPVAGDWTGKGYDSIGVYRPSTSTFYLRDSNTSGPPDHTVTLGISGDVPIVGDWTGKGYDSVGVFRPSNGVVYLRNSNTTGAADLNFIYGKAGDKPVVGDWNTDGVDTIGVDRGGRFLLRNANSTGPANLSFYLGAASDQPIAGPWLAPPGSQPSHRGSTHGGLAAAALPTRRALVR